MKHHIVAIGISKHKNQITNLAFAEKDATEFFSLFQQNISNIGYNKLLVDEEATLSEIKTALGKELLDNIESDDVFFFFYSGHGALVDDPNNINSGLSFLVPYDATHDIVNTCLSVEDIKNIFTSLKSKVNLIFIDSCFSGSVSKNAKNYPIPNTKGFKNIKSFSNTVIGNGSMIFTASKDDELSIEDPELKNGLFTYYVLDELQKNRPSEYFSATDIFSPIAEGVSSRARDKWKHTQTPTMLGKLEGNLTLPVFKKRLHLKPETIEIPKTPELQNAIFSVPVIDLTMDEKNKLLQETINFVVGSSGSSVETINILNFERLCHKLITKIKKEWEIIFQEIGQDVDRIPEAISRMEASSYQYIYLGATISVYGNKNQIKIYCEYLTALVELTNNKSGLISLIAVPEVIIVEILYIIATICIARDNYAPLKILLETKFDNPNYFDQPPMSFLEDNHFHYTRALTGHSTKVNEYIREYLKNQDWLIELVPKMDGKIENFQFQANFLLVVLSEHNGEPLWADFGRYYGERIMPFVKKILFDKNIRIQLAGLMNLQETEVRLKLIEYITTIQKRGLNNYWWESINPAHLMTDEEKKVAGIK
ncbi:MAG: caspase family protein [Patescibacteria group bacterium]